MIEEINNYKKYLTYQDVYKLRKKYNNYYKKVTSNFFLIIKNIKFIYYYENMYKIKKKQNKFYIKKEIHNTKDLLDNINGFSLDYEQRKAVITDEDNILLIAGAGSGKTLTIIGKIRYLIERKEIKEDEILCISFTNDSVNDIKQALQKNYNYNVDVFTFHKLALNVLKEDNDTISIVKNDTLDYVVNEYLMSHLINSPIFEQKNEKIYIQFKNLIKTFINLFKSNNFKLKDLNLFIKNAKNKEEYLLLILIKNIYIEYELELNSQNQIDFNDMINKAAEKVKDNMKYKYIIIDEFQDTSYTRYNLIKQIKIENNTKIVAVGDDFQSIYRFTGCDLNIFINFEKYFGKTEILKIQQTYRNSKELIEVAGNFVMKNKKQIRKKLKSLKSNSKPIKIVYYNNLESTIKELSKKIKTNFFILGRNNNDFNEIKNFIVKNEIKFLTVHRSKGLEAENVIVLNNIDNILGFPNKIINNEILKYVLKDDRNYQYEEERRLFYVAITRTKNEVYLLTKKGKESIFIKELLKNYKKYIKILKM